MKSSPGWYQDEWGTWHNLAAPDLGNMGAHEHRPPELPPHLRRPDPTPAHLRPAVPAAIVAAFETHVDTAPEPIVAPEPVPPKPIDAATGLRLLIKQLRNRAWHDQWTADHPKEDQES